MLYSNSTFYWFELCNSVYPLLRALLLAAVPKQLGYTLGNIISRQGHEFNIAV